MVSGWAKADSVPITSGRYFALYVGIQGLDGSYQYVVVPFNEASSDWQYISSIVKTDRAYKSINVYGLYYNNANSACFDGFRLYKEEFGDSYTYDSKGNLASAKDVAKQNSSFAYNTTNDLITSTDPKGSQFKYEYDTKHNVAKATSAENVVYSFTYDSSGNPLTSKVGDGVTFINSSATYTTSGNYLKSIKDSLGNTVNYNYNETKGTLDTVTDSKNNTVFNSYDEMDKLTGINSIVSSSNLEIFPLGGTTNGTKGTKPVSDSAVYAKDENGKTVLYANGGTKTIYDLGLNKNAGTMSAWTKSTGSSGTRYVFFSMGSNNENLCVYIDTSNNVNVAVRNTSETFVKVVTSTTTINTTAWNFIALEWKVVEGGLQCTLYLNGNSYVNTAANYKDFTGGQTAIGSYVDGTCAINGLVDEYIYSNTDLGSTTILDIYNTQRGKYLDSKTINNKYSYNNDRLSTVTQNGFNYNFGYNSLGNNTTVSVGTQNLITNGFEARTGKF